MASTGSWLQWRIAAPVLALKQLWRPMWDQNTPHVDAIAFALQYFIFSKNAIDTGLN